MKSMHIVLFFLSLQKNIFCGIVDTLSKAAEQFIHPSHIVVGIEAEKQDQREKLRHTLEKFRSDLNAFPQEGALVLESVKTTIADIEQQLKSSPKNEILQNKLLLYAEMYQAIKDNKRTRERIVAELEEFIQLISKFLKDPYFQEYQKNNKLGTRMYYSFEDMLLLHDLIEDKKKQIEILVDQEKSTRTELESRKQAVSAALDLYKKKKDRLNIPVREDDESVVYTRDLMVIDEQLHNYKKEQEKLYLKEIEIKSSFIAMETFLNKSQLDILQTYLKKIKPYIRVSELDLLDEKELLAQEKKKYFIEKEQLRHSIDKIIAIIKQKESNLELLSKEYTVPLGKDLDFWIREIEKSASSYLKLYEVASLNTEIIKLKNQKELMITQEVLLDKNFEIKEIKFDIKVSYHKIAGRSISEEMLEKEIKKYAAPRARAKADSSRYSDKAARTPDMQNDQKKVFDAIINQRSFLQNNKTFFKTQHAGYLRCLELLNRSEQLIKENIEIVGKLTSSYSLILSDIATIDQLVTFIQDELSNAGGVLSRPEYAITWEGFKNIIPDVATFLRDLRSYITHLNFNSLSNKIQTFFYSRLLSFRSLMWFLLSFIFVVFAFFVMPYAESICILIASKIDGIMHIIMFFIIMIIQFIRSHFVMIGGWILLYAFLKSQVMQDPYAYIFFYLFSIPYLLYIMHRLIVFCDRFNEQNNYIFLSKEFHRRFLWVISILVSSTLIIVLFRQAFILANYTKSELPKVLFAINFIIFQTSLMLLLTKDLILSLIPQGSTVFAQWLREHIDRYYFLIQIIVFATIVMSNPYVGFGKFVLYVLLNCLLSALLIGFLWWLNNQLKEVISQAFFLKSDDIVRERFSSAKTWFGLSLVTSFVVFALVAGIIIARIWGWIITVRDVTEFINEPLMFKGTPDPVTAVSLLKVVGFIVGGFLVSYAVNRFILIRIYDLFLVDTGVQYTVTSITRYLIFIITVLVGFSYVGLGQHIGYLLAALAVSIGWVLKDPINDFISYFIILVQRPIKIGDYVQINQDTQGVVRRITPRSVILRRKNSTTLVVPNSYFIGQTIENWNYSRSFIALNDILFTIDYDCDPEEVQRVLFIVIQEHPHVLRNPKSIVRLENFSDYGYVFLVRPFVSTLYVLEMWDIASDIRLQIIKALRKHNMRIAIPVRVIHQGVSRHAENISHVRDR